MTTSKKKKKKKSSANKKPAKKQAAKKKTAAKKQPAKAQQKNKAAAKKKTTTTTKKKNKKKKKTSALPPLTAAQKKRRAQLEPKHQKIFDAERAAYGEKVERITALWERLVARGAKMRPGASLDDGNWEAIEYALDNHNMPDELQIALQLHDGEDGDGGSVVDGFRLLSLSEIVGIELAAHGDAALAKDVVAVVEAKKRHDKPWKMKPRTSDARIQMFGPALSFTFAVGAKGRHLLIDLDAPDLDRDLDESAVLEVAADGRVSFVADSYGDWLESVAGAGDDDDEDGDDDGEDDDDGG